MYAHKMLYIITFQTRQFVELITVPWTLSGKNTTQKPSSLGARL